MVSAGTMMREDPIPAPAAGELLEEEEEPRAHEEEEEDCQYLDIEIGHVPAPYPRRHHPQRHDAAAAPAAAPARAPALISCLAGTRQRRRRQQRQRNLNDLNSLDNHNGDAAPATVRFNPQRDTVRLIPPFSPGSSSSAAKSALFYSRAECRAFRREVERELEQHRMLVDLVADERLVQPRPIDGAGSRSRASPFDDGDDVDDECDDDVDIFSGALPIHLSEFDCEATEHGAPAALRTGNDGGAGVVPWRERAAQAAMVATAVAACYCGGGLMDQLASADAW